MLSEKLQKIERQREEQWNAERLRTGLENSKIHWVTEPRDKRILQLAFEEIERLRKQWEDARKITEAMAIEEASYGSGFYGNAAWVSPYSELTALFGFDDEWYADEGRRLYAERWQTDG